MGLYLHRVQICKATDAEAKKAVEAAVQKDLAPA